MIEGARERGNFTTVLYSYVSKNSTKFSRRIILAFFVDWSGTTKIRCREMRLTVKGVANKFP